MIQKEDIIQIYDKGLFQETSDELTIKEPDKSAFIKGTTLVLKDAIFFYSNESIWSASEGLFLKKSDQHFSKFRSKTDGFVFCFYHGKNYMIWLELKSSFNQIFNKAIYQLCACYSKAKIMLNPFTNYDASNFKELCIVISKPEGTNEKSVEGNDAVTSRRNQLTSQPSSIAEQRCKKRYKNTGEIILDYHDFDLQNTNIRKSFLPHDIPIIHIPSSYPEPTVDLLAIIKGQELLE